LELKHRISKEAAMKKLLAVLFISFITLGLMAQAGKAEAADETKVGFINLQEALNESAFGRETKGQLEEIIKQKQAAISSKIDTKEMLEQELDKQSPMLSEEAVRQRSDEIDKLERDIERLISDSNTEIQKMQREKEVAILKELDDIIQALGRERGYTVILPADVVIYAGEGLDITQEVIKRYDKMKGAEKK